MKLIAQGTAASLLEKIWVGEGIFYNGQALTQPLTKILTKKDGRTKDHVYEVYIDHEYLIVL